MFDIFIPTLPHIYAQNLNLNEKKWRLLFYWASISIENHPKNFFVEISQKSNVSKVDQFYKIIWLGGSLDRSK